MPPTQSSPKWGRFEFACSTGNHSAPGVLAEEIAENLESALGSFKEIIAQLKKYNMFFARLAI